MSRSRRLMPLSGHICATMLVIMAALVPRAETAQGQMLEGSIVAWGDNNQGQCNVPEPNTGLVAVAGGGRHSLGLKADGSIIAWGEDRGTNVPTPNRAFVAVAAGGYHSLALNRCTSHEQCDDGLFCNGSVVEETSLTRRYRRCDVSPLFS